MKPQHLIYVLKNQHRIIQDDMSSALKSINSETMENGKNIVLNLLKFKNDLLQHLELENKMFYSDYLKKIVKRGEKTDSTKKFIEEMEKIAEVVMNFLEKYASPKIIDASPLDFKKELTTIIGIINIRIETEEDGIFNIYLSM